MTNPDRALTGKLYGRSTQPVNAVFKVNPYTDGGVTISAYVGQNRTVVIVLDEGEGDRLAAAIRDRRDLAS